MAPLDVNKLQNMNWYTMQPVRTGAVGAPPAVETTPPEYVGGGDNFFIPQHKSPTLTVGDHYYTNNPDKTKAYSEIPSFMTWG